MFDRSDEFREKIWYGHFLTLNAKVKATGNFQFRGSFNQQFPGQKHLLLGQFNGI